MKILSNGLATGLILQLAIGPIFFFVFNLTIQRTILDGFVAVIALALVDYFYIIVSILGVGKLLENKKIKKVFGVISSIVLILFGIFIVKGMASTNVSTTIDSNSLFSSFISVFILAISSPLTIFFFTSIFTAKAVEYNYTKEELWVFGFGTGLATILFMGASVMLFSLFRGTIPVSLIQISNTVVGCLLIGYGGIRFTKILKER